MAVSNFLMAITNAPWCAFPYQFPAVCPHL
jgi:predicted ABC-class ATPase